jgi:O-antigen ligase
MSKRAHNDYLELLANQGIIGFSIFAAAIGLLIAILFGGLNNRTINTGRGRNLYGVKIGSYCAVTAILMHSVADFNFQLPVNAVYFWVIVAIGIKANLLNKQHVRNQRD